MNDTMIDRVESASYDPEPEPMTPPTHPETEKLIAEFLYKLWQYDNRMDLDEKLAKEIHEKDWSDWLRTAFTTSFASGRAQGAKEERERIKQGIEEVEPKELRGSGDAEEQKFSFGRVMGYNQALADYKSNLLQMVEGKK